MAIDLAGKMYVITGANVGIGKATAEILAARGASLILACRSEEKTAPVVADLQARHRDASFQFESLDLSRMAAAESSAKRIVARHPRIDGLINNAGVAAHSGLTPDGYEWTFGVNHLGPFAFTLPFRDVLKSSKGRIVNVASRAHFKAKGLDFAALEKATVTRTGLNEYAVSKLSNVLFAKSLTRLWGADGIESYSLHPGVVASEIWKKVPWPIRPMMKMFMITNEEGAATSVYCAASSEVTGKSGQYFDKCAAKAPNALADDERLQDALWAFSMKALEKARAGA